MVLPSSFEGWACVFLESMACGTPVIATTVGGNAEVICEPDAGVLIAERSASAVADAIRQLLATPPPREATRTVAERFSWDVTAAGQLRLFRDILAGR
jgi:glycosyltransferase involved in cell wall biosynthesis